MISGRSKGERFEGLELLRFLLALGVVVYHYYFFGPHDHLIPVAPIDGIGLDALMFGVEAFFAVSGFVIVLSVAHRTPAEFLVARMARLAPTLLVASTVTLFAYHALHVAPYVSGAGLKYLISITFFPLARMSSGLDPSLWSLTFEIRFYALIFACMFAFDVQANAVRIAIALLAYDAIRLTEFSLTGHALPARVDLLRDYAPFFALGILLYHRHAAQASGSAAARRSNATFLLTAGAALALGAIRCTQLLDQMDRLTLHVGPVAFWRGIPIECAIFLLMVMSLRDVRDGRAAMLFRGLGRTSYPLYVIHQLCGYWMINFVTERLHLNFDIRPFVIVVMVAVSLSFGNLVEPQLIHFYRKVLTDAVRAAAALIPRSPPSRVRAGASDDGTGGLQLTPVRRLSRWRRAS